MFTITRNPDGSHDVPEPLINELKVRKKPIIISAYKMWKDFQVETLEGMMKGKNGDYLMVGVNGEMYPCDKEIFEKTYDIIEK